MSKEIYIKGYSLFINDIEVGDCVSDGLWYYGENLSCEEIINSWTDFDDFFESGIWKRISSAKRSRFCGKKITFNNLSDVITKANFNKAEINRFYTQLLEPISAKEAFEHLQVEDFF